MTLLLLSYTASYFMFMVKVFLLSETENAAIGYNFIAIAISYNHDIYFLTQIIMPFYFQFFWDIFNLLVIAEYFYSQRDRLSCCLFLL